MEASAKQANSDLDPSLKLAIAMAIVQSRRRQKPPSSATTAAACNGDSQAFCSNTSESDPIKWKRKMGYIMMYFLNMSRANAISMIIWANSALRMNLISSGIAMCFAVDFSDKVFTHPLLHKMRLSERKRRLDGSVEQLCISDSAIENEMEQLRASVDFLVDLCETSSSLGVEEGNFKNWSHQAVDFILATLKVLLCTGKIDETVESIVSSLIVRLMRRMCNGSPGDELLEEWVSSVFHAKKALELLESRNALYILYMDRVVGDLTRHLGQVSFIQKLRPDTLAKLFG
ncbi:hypothetical protein BUALT_Bualt12G0077800 [Buddleja alternifolia]|uniref:Uncharacterized protein n=1 Tax=Buddleja alternifolia TaxID=168488 RepID=A0AAV6WNH2_9LAMI|nr:hypothetical protein BUALT_Bualt12G0077800 [Buddleja alternifolia]